MAGTGEAAIPHRIVVVGGGAGGLELATRLGNKLGRRRKAADHAGRRGAHASLEAAAARGRRRQHGPATTHELDYLAQAHWHDFRYRVGEMIGLDRERSAMQLGATIDEEGRQVTPAPARALRHAGHRHRQPSPTISARRASTQHAIALDTPEQAARFHRRLVNACLRAHSQAEPVRPGPAARRHHRRRRHRHRAGGRAAPAPRAQLVAYGLDRIDPDTDIKIP